MIVWRLQLFWRMIEWLPWYVLLFPDPIGSRIERAL